MSWFIQISESPADGMGWSPYAPLFETSNHIGVAEEKIANDRGNFFFWEARSRSITRIVVFPVYAARMYVFGFRE
jgi:hypothetical protein